MVNHALEFAKRLLEKDSTGHDYHHILRVTKLALRIAQTESGADPELVGLIAALHDVDDRKLSPETCKNQDNAGAFWKMQASKPGKSL